MKRKFIRVSCAFLVCLVWFAFMASAQLFADDRKSERILLEIKKLNTRVVEQVIPQIQNTNLTIERLKAEINKVRAEVNRVKSGNKTVNQQMEILSSVIPAMQGSMEQSQAQSLQEIQSLSKRLPNWKLKSNPSRDNKAQHQKAELDAIKQEVSTNLQNLKGRHG